MSVEHQRSQQYASSSPEAAERWTPVVRYLLVCNAAGVIAMSAALAQILTSEKGQYTRLALLTGLTEFLLGMLFCFSFIIYEIVGLAVAWPIIISSPKSLEKILSIAWLAVGIMIFCLWIYPIFLQQLFGRECDGDWNFGVAPYRAARRCLYIFVHIIYKMTDLFFWATGSFLRMCDGIISQFI